MRKIKEVLRLKLDVQLSHERIAASFGISKGVDTKYISLAAAAGLDWAEVQLLDETALQHRLVGAPRRGSGFVAPDYGRMHQELRRKGRTLARFRSGSGCGSRHGAVPARAGCRNVPL